MASRVTVPRVECRDQTLSEREVCRLQLRIHMLQVVRESSPVLVEQEPTLGCQELARRREEESREKYRGTQRKNGDTGP